ANDRGMALDITRESGVVDEIDQRAILAERIDDAQSLPLHGSTLDILGFHQRQFAVRFHVQPVEWTDEHGISPSCDADPNFTASRFQRGEIRFETPRDG
ncbi:hypothetical protein RZS08_21170, partial [Arthrospira platensis SPKY1]|nr:hypothetical protein [Arthrospira platensis SPKY1]